MRKPGRKDDRTGTVSKYVVAGDDRYAREIDGFVVTTRFPPPA